MHRPQRLTWFRLRRARVIRSVLVAVVLAGVLTVTRPIVGWLPICAAFTPDDIEWLIFGCWIDPPPKDPRT